MKKNYAFIFARGGSKELKNKNIKLFNGKPLIYYSINLAKKSKKIKKIFVSSDDKKILEISRKYGAQTILRPKSLSKDNSSELNAWKHAINYVKEKGENFDNFISLPCTSPLRNLKDINKALQKLKNKKDLVIGISTSGKSKNVINALETAKSMGIYTVALTGGDGGNLVKIADCSIVVPSDHTPIIQQSHITIGHIICGLIEEKLEE